MPRETKRSVEVTQPIPPVKEGTFFTNQDSATGRTAEARQILRNDIAGRLPSFKTGWEKYAAAGELLEGNVENVAPASADSAKVLFEPAVPYSDTTKR